MPAANPVDDALYSSVYTVCFHNDAKAEKDFTFVYVFMYFYFFVSLRRSHVNDVKTRRDKNNALQINKAELKTRDRQAMREREVPYSYDVIRILHVVMRKTPWSLPQRTCCTLHDIIADSDDDTIPSHQPSTLPDYRVQMQH